MKLELNVEYTLKDNKGYIMAVDQSTPFETIINFIGDYTLDAINIGIMYKLFQNERVVYIYLVKDTGSVRIHNSIDLLTSIFIKLIQF